MKLPPATFEQLGINFNPQAVGTIGPYRRASVLNLEKFVETISNVTIRGPFRETHSCTTIAPFASCEFGIAFAPRTPGFQVGYVSVTVESPRIPRGTGRTTTLVVTGQGVPAVTVLPGALTFGLERIGSTSGPRIVTLANNQNSWLRSVATKVSGDFLAENGCGTQLAPHGTCTLSVRFRPTVSGGRTGMLSVTGGGVGSQFVRLNGRGE